MGTVGVLPFITKVQVPKLPRHWVQRPRLLEKLRSNLDRRVAIVWAPAGYGKTTLLADLAGELYCPTCWYSFLPEDREPCDFLAYCVRAVQRQVPHFGDNGCAPADILEPHEWLTSLGLFVNALQSEVRGELTFILDDVHHVDAKPELQKALGLLVERAPDHIHFVLSSRTRPTLAGLPRLASRGEVAWLTAEDLRFTAPEAEAMLAKMDQPTIRPEDLHEVIRRTDGWVTGILLGGGLPRDGGHSPDADALLQSVLFDYQTREMLDDLPAHVRQFLLRSSILPEFTPELCNAVLATEDAQEVLREIQRRGLLLQELSGPRATYRYHDLFREYLEQRLGQEHGDDYKRLHLKAAALFDEQGNHDIAIAHLHKAGDTASVAHLIKRVADEYLSRGRWQTLAAWLGLLPEAALAKDPPLGLVRARVRLRLGDTTGALQQIDAILASPAPADGHTEGRALALRSYACRLLGKLDLACAAAEQAAQRIRLCDGSTQDLAEAYRQLASAQATQGRLTEAVPNFETALALASGGDLQLETLVHDGLGAANIEMGKLTQAALHLEKARQGWARLGNKGALADTLNNLAILRYYQGEFELALGDLAEAMRLARASGYLKAVACALVSQGIVLRALGKYKEALTSFEEGLARARELRDSRLVAEATSGLGNCFRNLGEPARGQVLLEGALKEAEESGQRYAAARYHLSLSKGWCATRELLRAAREIEAARTMLAQLGIVRCLVEVGFWDGLLQFRQGKTATALQRLSEVATLVERLGYSGFLLADTKDTLELIRFGAVKQVGNGLYAHLLSRALERIRPPPPDHTHLDTLPQLRGFALGQESVVLDQHDVGDQEWGSRKAKELLFFLLCKSKEVGKDEAIDALWPEVALDSGSDVLKSTVYRLRKATYSDLVQASGQGYRGNPSAPVDFDVTSFQEHLRQAGLLEKGSDRRRAHLEQAIALYRGPFLPDFYSEWCETLRRDLEEHYHRALVTLAGYYSAKADLDRSCELLRKVLASDPLHEEANYQLILSYLSAGEHSTGRKCLRAYEALLEQELGCPLPKRFSQLASQPLAAARP